MQRINRLWIIGVMCLFASCHWKSAGEGVQSFDLMQVVAQNQEKVSIAYSDIWETDVLRISARGGSQGIVIWEKGNQIDWTEGSYLVLELLSNADYSGTINIEFYKENTRLAKNQVVLQGGAISGTDKDAPWISCLMGILPKLKTQLVFPLSYLDAQNLFVPRTPRQLKGTVSGNRLNPADITKVLLRFGPYDEVYYNSSFELASIFVSSEKPHPFTALEMPVIDSLGQTKMRNWKGKIESISNLIEENRALVRRVGEESFPREWGKYGGWKQKRFKATGFFRTHHDGKRWWLVDPEGYAFLSTGIDCIRASSSGPVDGIEDLFDWIPFDEGLMEADSHLKNVDFYAANLERAFGENWRGAWEKVTAGLMRSVRCNTIGNWSDINFARSSKIPYVLPLEGFPATQISLYRDFPDVFAEEYISNARLFARQLEQFKDDPYLVGYFLVNEPQWAFGYHNLAYEMFATDQQSATKSYFVRWLDKRYRGDVNLLNSQWKLNLSAISELQYYTFDEYPSEIAKEDFHAFSLLMVEKYVDIPCDEVKKIDAHHLNLGMRYAWLSSDLLYKAGERFDVFSINGYGLLPPSTAEIANISGKPIMIGEFHHGAVDRALPATGIVGVLNQEERAMAYRNYIEQGFARPELVGMHYFQWVDQPYYGRFDGENYNIGLVTTCNLPYPELEEAMRLTNERIYKIAIGELLPCSFDIDSSPYIHY